MYFILTYKTAENYIEKRIPFREQHLTLAKEYHEKGILIMAGALANPVDKAMLVFKCDDKSEVERFVSSDPYVQNNLIVAWEIREWTVVVGGV